MEYVPSPLLPSTEKPADLQGLVEEMAEGKVETLFVLGGNPAFDAPADVDFAGALRKVSHTFAMSRDANETTQLCGWVIPESHFLEAWGDVRGSEGTASIIQPLIEPLYESLSPVELLAELVAGEKSGYEAVRQTWREELGKAGFEPKWQQALRLGVIEEKPAETATVSLGKDLAKQLQNPESSSSSEGWTVLFRPDPTLWDGRYANNGWLQELSKPLSKLTWDNAAWMNRSDAEREGLSNGDGIVLSAGEKQITVPIWILPGQPAGCLTLFFGYGRRVVGRAGEGTGVNVFPLRTQEHLWNRGGVKLSKANFHRTLASTQHHQLMEGRHLVRGGTLEEYQEFQKHQKDPRPPKHPPFVSLPEVEKVEANFYESWKYEEGHRWGMSIDLTACTGCTACVIACQAENNIPVVGKTEVINNREMQWIRIDTWYEGESENPEQTLHQPVACVHCEQAPCELVCPVAATNHSDEGLNQMVYNRCVGTRYCSNNCPYKVRRFNFLDFSDKFITSPSLELLPNPEVTVRSAG